jgi:hypothetical protein
VAYLVRDRIRAIELAFGVTFVPTAAQLQVVLLNSRSAAGSGVSGLAA